jgi:hypothetical protein
MNEHDLTWLAGVLAEITVKGRVRCSTARGCFSLHKPGVVSAENCDFAVFGQRRQHVGEERHWQDFSLKVGKILRVTKRRLVVQDVNGRVFVLTASTLPMELENERS